MVTIRIVNANHGEHRHHHWHHPWLRVAGVLVDDLCQCKGVSLHGALRAAWFLEAVISAVSGGWDVHTMIGQTKSTTGRCFVRQRRLPDGSQAWACTAQTPHLSFVTWPWWRVDKPSWCGEGAGHWRGLAEREWNLPLIQTCVHGPWATMRFTRNDALNKRCSRQAKVVGSRVVHIGQQGHSVQWDVSKMNLSRILKQALYFVRSGAVDHEREGASRDRENHLWGAHDAHPLLRTARSSWTSHGNRHWGERGVFCGIWASIEDNGSARRWMERGKHEVRTTPWREVSDDSDVRHVSDRETALRQFGIRSENLQFSPYRTSSRECVCGQHTQPLEDVENKMKRRRTGAGIIDVTGSGLESVSCLEEVIHQE